MVFGWFSLFFKTLITPQMYLSELYLGPTVQSRSAARRTDQDLYNKILQIGWSYDESVCWWCWGKASTKVTAGCYGADSEGWFDPWALLQVQNCLCKKKKTKSSLSITGWFYRLSSCPPNMVESSMSKEKWLRSLRCKNEFSIICVKCHSKFARIYFQGRIEVVLNHQIQVNRNSDGNPSSALISNPSGDKEASLSTAWHHHHHHHHK